MIDFREEKSNKRLIELHLREAEELAEILSQKYGLPYIDLSKQSISTDALRLIPEKEAREAQIAAFKLTGRTIHIAFMSPNNDKVQSILEDIKNKNYILIPYLCSEASLQRCWERYNDISASSRTKAGIIEISDEEINAQIEKFKDLKDITSTLEAESKDAESGVGGISTILETILAGALTTKASDIHVEPEELVTRLRYRLDGVLQDITDLNPRIYQKILSRIKLVSGLRLNIRQSAQDGRFAIKVSGTEIEIRTSILPSAYGESIVMRVLNPKSIAATFETLGVDDHLFKIFETEINKPNGLILLTGPTGSGKTTTLYSFLRKVNSSELKIITIEDPIEYHLEGINQTQVNVKKGYTFLSGLRSALRQDPDIIMVGEIRDAETAKIAINSALTGHLVFSSLHTNNAAGAIPRLIDLGINPKIMSSALTLSIAQRLVRKLCETCKKEDVPNEAERKLITEIVPTIRVKKPNLEIPSGEKIYRPVGCKECHMTGFKGRQGVFEAIAMDAAIAATALTNPSEREIKIAAIPQGILDMRQDGVLKILQGTTSMDELARVVDLNQEVI
ncbi:MAG TPA: GspE/PulE family protein [Candidatus Paceibacterota bacterium]|nr:GspE/PulE family protein [Candidatus Paceibacterota bacterium]